MGEDKNQALPVPDFKSGVEFASLADGVPLLGHFEGDPVMMVRRGEQIFATGAACTHYGGPLEQGLVVGETIRCPLHHARFSLRTGEAEGAPALNPVSCFNVRRRDNMVMIDGAKTPDFRVRCPLNPSSVVIVGAGASGAACADMLRTKGYAGPTTLVGDEEPGPVDRPNLSKDFLAGTAAEDWIPLRTREYYESIRVELVTGDPAVRISPAEHQVSLRSGRTLNYGALLLATGAEPRSLSIEGADLPHVHRLRSLADSKAIIAKAQEAKTCAVIGSGFIGLEVAASLRHRGLQVSVIGQESIPLGKILGEELGRFIQKLHERQGVRFFLNTTPRAIRENRVEIGDSARSVKGVRAAGAETETPFSTPRSYKEDAMATQNKINRWVKDVKTDSTHPPEGLFKKDAATIAKSLASKRVSPKGLVSGLRMLTYFLNRGGEGLSKERRAELEKAKRLLSERIHAS